MNDVIAGKYIIMAFGTGAIEKRMHPAWVMSMVIRTVWLFWNKGQIFKAIRRKK
jgi:hypothetical protein